MFKRLFRRIKIPIQVGGPISKGGVIGIKSYVWFTFLVLLFLFININIVIVLN